MIPRPFTIEDYPTVQHWWHLNTGKDFVPFEVLPEDGIIVDDVCAIWIYLAKNAPFAYMAWNVVMPDCPPKKVKKGLEIAIEECAMLARREGVKVIMIPHQRRSMHRLLKGCGFIEGEDTTLFTRSL